MSDPGRVLHVTRDFPPNINGGLSIAVGGLAAAQVRSGHECIVVSFDDYRHKSGGARAPGSVRTSTTGDGIRVIHVANVDDLAEAETLASESECDVVHVHHGLLWDFAAAVAGRTGAPTVLTVHVLQSEQNRLRGIETTHSSDAQTRALAECTRIHAPSQAVADILLADKAALAAKLAVVRLGSGTWPGAAAARAHQPTFEGPEILYVGRFADINGFAELLEALAALVATHSTLRATIVGGMPDNPKAERRWKKRWQTLTGVHANRVHWTGWIDSEALSSLYGKATMLILPSWFETFGQVLLEGMLHGTPIITTGAGALGELADETTARLIAPKSAEAIVSAVRELLENPEAARSRGDRALARVLMGQRWEDRVVELASLYATAIAGVEAISHSRE